MQRAIRVPDLVQELDTVQAGLIGNLLVWLARSQGLLDVVGASTAKDDNIEERVGTKTVGAVNGHTGSLTSGIETRNNLVLAILINGQDFTSVLGGNTAHYSALVNYCKLGGQ